MEDGALPPAVPNSLLTNLNAAGEQSEDEKSISDFRERTCIHTCDCGNSWCGKEAGNGESHRVPHGKHSGAGRLWLRRVLNHQDPDRVLEAKLEDDKCKLLLHRSHFYPSHLYTSGGRVLIRAPSTFNADPKFRSRTEIRSDVQAPLTDVTSVHGLPSDSYRDAIPSTLFPINMFSERAQPSSSSSSSSSAAPPPPLAPGAVSASARKRTFDEHQREHNPAAYFERQNTELAKALVVAEDKMLLMSKNTIALEARIAELQRFQGVLSWEYFMRTQENFPLKAFTGKDSTEQLSAFYDLLNHDGVCDRLQLYRDPDHSLNVSEKERARRADETRGTERALTSRDGLAMTLFVLRTGNTFTVTAPLFGVSRTTVSRHFITWLRVLELVLDAEFPYPTVDQLNRVTTDSVREAMSMQVEGLHFEAFVDCHEQPCEDPSSFLAHKKVFSSYKGFPTLKFFGAVAGNGAFTFTSTAYRGRLSDPVITRLCGFLEIIHEHGIVGADKGFDMIADFSSKRSLLVVPPKAFNGQAVYTADEMVDTSAIARARIHVERAFKRAQEYQILHNKIPVTMYDIWGSIFRVCCFLTNFEAPLIQDKY